MEKAVGFQLPQELFHFSHRNCFHRYFDLNWAEREEGGKFNYRVVNKLLKSGGQHNSRSFIQYMSFLLINGSRAIWRRREEEQKRPLACAIFNFLLCFGKKKKKKVARNFFFCWYIFVRSKNFELIQKQDPMQHLHLIITQFSSQLGAY